MMGLVLKKKSVFFTLLFCMSIFGTLTLINGQSNNTPPWLNDYPPDDEIWGIGFAKLVNSGNSMNLAEIRARSSIATQIYAQFVEYVGRENDDEFNNLYMFYRDYISLEGSFEIMNSTRVVNTWVSPNGDNWCLIAMKKSDAGKYESILGNLYKLYYDEIFKRSP